ncbi:MAG: hypothetical protein KME57_02645 [Scytonema hyalinum WJT4-NPBG1]|jgi:chromosome segregation ATPase|nr:hypothetical protein [Scytonema hyalinum WJT4-NPBG1]
MPNQNTDLDVLRVVLMLQLKLVDAIKAERHRNAIQDCRLSDHDSRITGLEKQNEEILQKLAKLEKKYNAHETQLQECQSSVNFLEDEIPHLRHLVGRNEELQNRIDFFCPPD